MCQDGRFFFKLNPKEDMKEATIKIAGKEVKVAYCYATEILFSDYTGQEFSEFIKEAVVDKNTQSSSKKVLYAVLSAIIARAISVLPSTVASSKADNSDTIFSFLLSTAWLIRPIK
jgi:hypothetical protein